MDLSLTVCEVQDLKFSQEYSGIFVRVFTDFGYEI